ncbi:polyribonucleotide nucleotidyltransferase [Alphaproteobacteria bacterium]|jgi:polyribonucleotide nucleotidyltransferase|nr:polyribonucleotide nucleotidyltransferase [Alphaproteobacteria bacterium]MDB2635728.1 polyribonucleotide nucleotidyltransferase [Alphaproteobacteria bacterium]MDC0594916.1 polyribonucleotide nucleotidyltransferase [Alphaproteobacteria bacterium]MDG2166275.1 polyribonucleotide nucleotidyltransferase [Alphaproteobacteria bacterium]
MKIEHTFTLGNQQITLETNRIAKQADASVVVTCGETMVMANICAAKTQKPDIDFFPLTVNYQEKYYASGKIPGGFFKREARPTERETLICRLIDRPIRPLFHKNFKNETQVTLTVLSYDGSIDPDIIAMYATGAALAVSGLPVAGTLGAARVGHIDGKLVANPSIQELEQSSLDLVVAGTEEGVLMVESEAKELPESTMLEAVMFGHDFYQSLIKEIQAFAGKTEIKNFDVPSLPEFYEGLQKDISSKIADPIREAYGLTDKQERSQKLSEIRSSIIENVEDDQVLSATTIIKDIEKDVVRGDIIKNKSRIDGRNLDEVRKITCDLDILPRAHGSSLFTRGETQALVVMTLGTGDDEQMIDSLDPMHKQHFMLHYNFPPYSVGEVGRSGFTSRREIGHGKLAWRAVNPMLPSKEDFPYTLRLVSEITESNGSSSMATVCGSSLALMAAGVPVKKHIGGIAMGLIKEGDDFVVLSDILGDEDHLGDMDFKVAGTMDGITSLQMDIKITSITKEIMEIALNQAAGGRKHIIGVMSEALPEARTKFSKHAPQVISISIDKAKIKDVIGSGGKVIRNIVEVSGAKLEVNDDGIVKIASSNEESINTAKQMVEDIVAEPEIGKVYNGKVVKIVEFGAFVNFMGARDGLLHVSQISQKRVENVSDVLSEGQEVQVKVLDVDRAGKVKLSMKEV